MKLSLLRRSTAELGGLLLFSFRMIGDTRIECQDANSAWKNTQSKTAGSDRAGAEP